MQLPIIKLLDVSMNYDNNVIFSNINLEIEPGEIVAAKGTIGSISRFIFENINLEKLHY